MRSRSPHRTLRMHRSEVLSRGLAQDEVGSRALLGVGALELAVGVVVGRSFRARQRSHMVAVLGLEGDEQLVLELARLRASRERGPRAAHRNVRQRAVRYARQLVKLSYGWYSSHLCSISRGTRTRRTCLGRSTSGWRTKQSPGSSRPTWGWARFGTVRSSHCASWHADAMVRVREIAEGLS